MKWTTRNGQHIAIADLSDVHLINILKMLWRNAEDAYQTAFASGDLWDMPYMQTVDYLPDGYNALEIEATRRGLNW